MQALEFLEQLRGKTVDSVHLELFRRILETQRSTIARLEWQISPYSCATASFRSECSGLKLRRPSARSAAYRHTERAG